MKRQLIAALLGAALLSLVASSCGSGDEGDPQVASLGDAAAATTTTTSTTVRDPEEAALSFARCMREHGIDVPDPDSSGRLTIRGPLRVAGRAGRGSDAQRKKFDDAQKACQDKLGASGPRQLSEEDRAAMQDAMLAYARCMRGEGIDFPDPDFSGKAGGFVMKAGRADDEKFKAADEKCRVNLRTIEERFGKREGSP